MSKSLDDRVKQLEDDWFIHRTLLRVIIPELMRQNPDFGRKLIRHLDFTINTLEQNPAKSALLIEREHYDQLLQEVIRELRR